MNRQVGILSDSKGSDEDSAWAAGYGGCQPITCQSGYPTDSRAKNIGNIREAGRWIADASLRTYLDATASANISANFRTSGLSTAMAYSVSHLFEYLPGSEGHQRTSDFAVH